MTVHSKVDTMYCMSLHNFGTYTSTYPNNEERLYEVTFAEKTMIVRASDLSQAEREYGAISSLKYLEMKIYVPSTVVYVNNGASLDKAMKDSTDPWRKGPNWT